MTNALSVPPLSLADQSSDPARFAEEFGGSFQRFGFAIIADHGIDPVLIDRAWAATKTFFALPLDAKIAYRAGQGGQRGYIPFGIEIAKGATENDLKEFWHVGREVPDDHVFSKYYPKNIWPDDSIPEFRPIFEKLFSKLEQAGIQMMEALTYPLEVEKTYFKKMVEEGNSILRLLHYPPIPEGVDPRCIRAAAHEDINFITILPAATQSGLQLKDRDGAWLDIETDFGALIVDAGDMLARLTNDVIPSTTHRVINPQDGTNQSRYSMPFFMHPHPESLLSCLPSCKGTVTHPVAKYADITAHEFLMQRLREIGLVK